jgi:hypothetical protein
MTIQNPNTATPNPLQIETYRTNAVMINFYGMDIKQNVKKSLSDQQFFDAKLNYCFYFILFLR